MTSGIVLSFRPAAFRACTGSSGDRICGDRRQKIQARSGGGGGGWWAPLFGWAAEPDYIDVEEKGKEEEEEEEEGMADRPGRRYGVLTEEKARELRRRTRETESFRDGMYHSVIARRLASDLPRGS